MLVYLASRPGESFRVTIWNGLCGMARSLGMAPVTSTVIKLRKALGDSAREPRYIATIPKQGYRLIASVEHPAAGQVAPRTVTGDPATKGDINGFQPLCTAAVGTGRCSALPGRGSVVVLRACDDANRQTGNGRRIPAAHKHRAADHRRAAIR